MPATAPNSFAEPFGALAAARLPAMVLDGEIAVPDARGVTHIDALTEALGRGSGVFRLRPSPLDGYDLRACTIEDRKALLRDLVGAAGGPRLLTVDHVVGNGAAFFEAVRELGAEGIISKRAGSPYRGGTGRDWLKTKVSEEGAFVITAFVEREAVAVTELTDGVLVPVGLVKFGLAGKELWRRLAGPRAGPRDPFRPHPGAPKLVAAVRYFGRYRTGWIVTACCCQSAKQCCAPAI
jgi:ATP-dependent DNA ligase